MTKLIGISGKIGSGKDTVANMLIEITDSEFQIKRFAGKLKKIVEMFTGIPAEELNNQNVKNTKLGPEWNGITVRELLQRLGTDAIRDNLHKNAWINAMFSDWKNNSCWIVPDVRFPNEFQAIKDKGGIIIRIGRAEIKGEKEHESETALDYHLFDYYIDNVGTIEDLQKKVLGLTANFKLVNPHRVADGVVI